jgi:hypothetical protein
MLKLMILLIVLFSFSVNANDGSAPSFNLDLCEDYDGRYCTSDFFLNTVDKVYFILNFSNVLKYDNITCNTTDPLGQIVEEYSFEIGDDTGEGDYNYLFNIKDENRILGEWTVTIFYNNEKVISKNFEIVKFNLSLCEEYNMGVCLDREGINPVPSNDSFLNTIDYAYFILELGGIPRGSRMNFKIKNPSGEDVVDGLILVAFDLESYFYNYTFNIADANDTAGVWSINISYNDVEVILETFEIIEARADYLSCYEQGYFCCDGYKICKPGHSRVSSDCNECCDSGNNCITIISDGITELEVNTLPYCDTNIFDNCEIVQGNIYNYSIHGYFDKDQTITFDYYAPQIRCYDKTAINIAYYDEIEKKWNLLDSTITQKENTSNYVISAKTDYVGYMAIVSNERCVVSYCSLGAYTINPFGGVAGVDRDIDITFCGIVPKCNADLSDSCDVSCVSGTDPDCGDCSSESGDCCLPAKDMVCDLDCYDNVDPDCCDKSKDWCCVGDKLMTGFEGCDSACGEHGIYNFLDDLYIEICKDCTSVADDCCYPANGDGCDSDCRIGIDPDCCPNYEGDFTPSNYSNIISYRTTNGCCDLYCDGLCDNDCITGTDPDCVGYCRRDEDICNVGGLSGTRIIYGYAGGWSSSEGVNITDTVLIEGDYYECATKREKIKRLI